MARHRGEALRATACDLERYRVRRLRDHVEAGGKPIPIRITGGALHALWGAGAGPQTAQGIFDEYRPMIDEIVADKILGERVDHGVVVVTDADLDM